MVLWFAAILGVVQGLTEFIPVSSSAHLRLIAALLGQPDAGAAYTAVLQLGTLLAVIAYFARDLWGLTRAVAALAAKGGAMIVTADHGNCEVMVDPVTGEPHTAHTTNPVPVILIGGPAGATLRNGRLADLAPTLLHLMGLPQPPEMTGKTLIA